MWDRPWKFENRSSIRDGEEGMLTHMLAYKLYDIPNTCGPDWDVCAEFDFERPVSKEITANNVLERSKTLMDQYRKKAKAFSHNNVLIPLGDDFKYKDIHSTRKMMENYERIFEYVNKNPDRFKIRIRFATLSDYFARVKQSKERKTLPKYDQDFFTYCDEGTDYWSGYFTTRPYLKKLIRVTNSNLRAANILYSISYPNFQSDDKVRIENDLIEAQETLGLLQHHDAVTGTAKQVVADDYYNKLINTNNALQRIIPNCYSKLLCDNSWSGNEIITLQRDLLTGSSRKISISDSNPDEKIFIFNPQSHKIKQIVKISTNKIGIQLLNSKYESIPLQIVPEFQKIFERAPNDFEAYDTFTVYFWVELEAFGFEILQLSERQGGFKDEISLLYNSDGDSLPFFNVPSASVLPRLSEISIENDFYHLLFNKNGQIENITYKNNLSIDLSQKYWNYPTRGGSYLFIPTSEATQIDFSDSLTYIAKGTPPLSLFLLSSSSSFAFLFTPFLPFLFLLLPALCFSSLIFFIFPHLPFPIHPFPFLPHLFYSRDHPFSFSGSLALSFPPFGKKDPVQC